MSLAFLDPKRAAGPARSPMLDVAPGAVGDVRVGWETIISFGDVEAERQACLDSVGFADLSHLTKLELQGPAESLAGLCDATEMGSAVEIDAGWYCPVAPDRALVLGQAAGGLVLHPDRFERGGARVCDLTAALAALAVVGPGARELFARFCALDLRECSLPVGGFRPGSIMRTPGYVLREDRDRFLMLFGAAYAQYAWEVVADAAASLGGRPVGLDALVSGEAPGTQEEQARA